MPAHGASNPSRVGSAVSPEAPFRAPNPPPAPASPSRCRTAQPAVTTLRGAPSTNAAASIRCRVAGVRGHIRVWANMSAIVQFLPVDLAGFLTAHPGIKVSLEERLSHEIVDALSSDKADLGVFADNVPAPGIERRLYRRDELVLLVPRGRRFAARGTVRFADTLDEDYVGLSDGSSLLARMTDAAFSAERSLKLRIQVSNFDGVSRMIEAGLGIGVLPRDAVTTERAGSRLCVVKLDDAWATRTLWVGVKAGSVLTSDIAKLFDFMSAR